MALEGFFNLIFGWALLLGKPWGVVIISFIITLLITLAYKYLTDQIAMKDLKGKIKDFQKQMKEHRSDTEKIQELQKQAMSTQMQYMKHSWKPMLYTFLPLILIFSWMRSTFNTGTDVINWGFKMPLFGTGLGWLGTYILASIVFSMVLRKILKIH